MTEARKLLEILQDVVPASTPVTVSSEITLLESLGVVSQERAVSAMKVGALLVAPDTQATFLGLMNLFAQLIRMNPDFGDEHLGVLNRVLAEARQVGDFPLTFGTFLSICQKLLDAKGKDDSIAAGRQA